MMEAQADRVSTSASRDTVRVGSGLSLTRRYLSVLNSLLARGKNAVAIW